MLKRALTNHIIPNLYLYSAHETTLAINLQTIGNYNNRDPPFASAVIYELHELQQGEFYVRVII